MRYWFGIYKKKYVKTCSKNLSKKMDKVLFTVSGWNMIASGANMSDVLREEQGR